MMKYTMLFPVLLFLLVPSLSQAQSFTKITTGSVVLDGGDSRGAVWTDYDADGKYDLFFPNASGQANFLYQNAGNNTFTKITTGSIVNDLAWTVKSSWADMDNDGDPDAFVTAGGNSSSLNNFLYSNNGNGSFTDITTGDIVTDGGFSTGCAWADYDNDGFADLYVGNHGGANNFLYQNNGGSTFSKITTGGIVNDGGNTRGVVWGDYDNDRFPDLFVANLNATNFLYHNNGNGTFTKVTVGAVSTDLANTASGSWGDYNNDGFLDLFVANYSGQNNALYTNNGDGTFTKVSSGAIVNDGGYSITSCWLDIDNDGFLDLFVSNAETGTSFFNGNFIYMNNGDSTFTKLTTGNVVSDLTTSSGAAWSDFNNDGFWDLALANRSNENNSLYSNDGNTNHWLKIHCEGIVSNRSALGTKVRIKAMINNTPMWQMREITSQSGYGMQNSMYAAFGLGNATSVDSLVIEWPSGLTCNYTGIPVDTLLVYTEQCLETSCATIEVKPDFSFVFTTPTEVLFTDLTAGNPDSIQWIFGDGTTHTDLPGTSISHLYAIVDTYEVCLEVFTALPDSSFCRDTLCNVLNLSSTGIDKIEEFKGWTVFPNPASTNITVAFDEIPQHMASIEIIDSRGRLVFYTETRGKSYVLIDVSQLSRGLYLISVKGNRSRGISRWIKE